MRKITSPRVWNRTDHGCEPRAASEKSFGSARSNLDKSAGDLNLESRKEAQAQEAVYSFAIELLRGRLNDDGNVLR
ncbi:MAG: hypothetical protein WA813_08485, partial [Beijerinckiaceae bacterium]